MRIDCLPALQDNYIFLLVDVEQRQAAVVDPAEAEPVLAALQAEGLTLTAILNTYHHGAHGCALVQHPGFSAAHKPCQLRRDREK